MTVHPETVQPETVHPEISHLAKEERIRAIAYAIWEEEGQPDGCADEHWLRACELVEVEAEGQESSPDWLKRAEQPIEPDPAPQTEATQALNDAIRRMKSSRAA